MTHREKLEPNNENKENSGDESVTEVNPIFKALEKLQAKVAKMEQEYMKERQELSFLLAQKLKEEKQARREEIQNRSRLHENTDLLGQKKQIEMLLNHTLLAGEFENKSFAETKLTEKLLSLGFQIDESGLRRAIRHKVEENLNLVAKDKEGHIYTFEGSKPLFKKEVHYILDHIDDADGRKYRRSFKQDIQTAIEDRYYEAQIKRGSMTAHDAQTIIETSGIAVPKTIQELARKELEE